MQEYALLFYGSDLKIFERLNRGPRRFLISLWSFFYDSLYSLIRKTFFHCRIHWRRCKTVSCAEQTDRTGRGQNPVYINFYQTCFSNRIVFIWNLLVLREVLQRGGILRKEVWGEGSVGASCKIWTSPLISNFNNQRVWHTMPTLWALDFVYIFLDMTSKFWKFLNLFVLFILKNTMVWRFLKTNQEFYDFLLEPLSNIMLSKCSPWKQKTTK